MRTSLFHFAPLMVVGVLTLGITTMGRSQPRLQADFRSSGTTLRTTNGSSHRNLAQTGVRKNLGSVSCVEAVRGSVVARGGVIPASLVLQTSNGGKLALANMTHTADTFYLPRLVISYITPGSTADGSTAHKFTYDASGNMLTWSEDIWSGSFRGILLRSYTYDGSGNMLTHLEEVWNGTQWVNERRITSTYDASGNMLTELHEEWDGTQWVGWGGGIGGWGRRTWTYDARGNMLTELWENWDGTQWVNGVRYTPTYDASGNILKQLKELWDGTHWVNDFRFTYTFDSSGNMLTELWEYWDGNWGNFWHYTSTYNASGNILTRVLRYWGHNTPGGGRNWVNLEGSAYTYDARGNMLTELWENWDGTQWVAYQRYTYTYDAQGNILVFSGETWSGSTWGPSARTLSFSSGNNDYYFYGSLIALKYTVITTSVAAQREGPGTSYELAQNYPNPFNPSTTIKYELPKSSEVRLSVFDMLGREVFVLVNERRDAGVHEVRFDGSNLASGVFFYRLQAGDFAQSRRLLLLK